MELRFRGWERQVLNHNIPVIPVEKGSPGEFQAGEKGAPLKWCKKSTAYGKVNGLELTGSFLVDFVFAEEELRNWLTTFVVEDPEAAIMLLSEMYATAVIELSKK